LTHPEAALTPEESATFERGLARLQAGEPLPYILGHWEFYGLDFFITPDVLIPRPETELLVDTALKQLAGGNHPAIILDVGTGSGCVAISIASHCPGAQIVATDISAAALAVAQRNAERHGVADCIQFIQADLFPLTPPPLPLGEGEGVRIDLLLANLPYIPTATLHNLDVYGKEPTLALDGGPDGLTLIRRLLEAAPPILAPGGGMLLEIEATQGEAASRLARDYFPRADIHILPDLAGYDRVLQIALLPEFFE
jgi:release factor glutamine methyltransferase